MLTINQALAYNLSLLIPILFLHLLQGRHIFNLFPHYSPKPLICIWTPFQRISASNSLLLNMWQAGVFFYILDKHEQVQHGSWGLWTQIGLNPCSVTCYLGGSAKCAQS